MKWYPLNKLIRKQQEASHKKYIATHTTRHTSAYSVHELTRRMLHFESFAHNSDYKWEFNIALCEVSRLELKNFQQIKENDEYWSWINKSELFYISTFLIYLTKKQKSSSPCLQLRGTLDEDERWDRRQLQSWSPKGHRPSWYAIVEPNSPSRSWTEMCCPTIPLWMRRIYVREIRTFDTEY
jgi:hypothetical protein